MASAAPRDSSFYSPELGCRSGLIVAASATNGQSPARPLGFFGSIIGTLPGAFVRQSSRALAQ